MNILTFDFGGTFVKYCLLNEDAEISSRGRMPAPLHTEEEFLDTIAGIYEKYRDSTDGIAVSMPGIIDSDSGEIVLVTLYPALSGKNLYRLLQERVNVPVSVENDGKAAILAEAWKGSLAGVSDAVCVLLGSGIGGGIFMDGKLRKGSGFAAGEISDLMIAPGIYNKENALCFDASVTGFLKAVARARNMDPALFEISGNASAEEKRISGRDVFEWLEDGDAETAAVYQSWIEKLTWLLINLKLTVSPQKIVIGGAISQNARFIGDLRQEYAEAAEVFAAGMPETQIDVCTFLADANLLGAAYCWLQMHG